MDKQIEKNIASEKNSAAFDATQEQQNSGQNVEKDMEEQTIEDTDPPLTEEDLEENNLSDEEADNIEWDETGDEDED